MPATQEISRRRLIKLGAAAGLSVISVPIIRERVRVNAQEAVPTIEEPRVVMPDPKTDDEFFEAFNRLIDRDMKPEGLDLLGITPTLADMENTPGAWLVMSKSTELLDDFDPYKPDEFAEKKTVSYTFHFNNPIYMEAPFYAAYTQYSFAPDTVAEDIEFNIAPDGKLRTRGDKQPLPLDSLKSIPEKYFKNIDPKDIEWGESYGYFPNNYVFGRTHELVENAGIFRNYSFDIAVNGDVHYINVLYANDSRDRRQEVSNMIMRNATARFNTPQV